MKPLLSRLFFWWGHRRRIWAGRWKQRGEFRTAGEEFFRAAHAFTAAALLAGSVWERRRLLRLAEAMDLEAGPCADMSAARMDDAALRAEMREGHRVQ